MPKFNNSAKIPEINLDKKKFSKILGHKSDLYGKKNYQLNNYYILFNKDDSYAKINLLNPKETQTNQTIKPVENKLSWKKLEALKSNDPRFKEENENFQPKDLLEIDEYEEEDNIYLAEFNVNPETPVIEDDEKISNHSYNINEDLSRFEEYGK